MSALARYFNEKGTAVSGYDKTPTPLTKQLINEGMNIHFEENINLIPSDIDLVIYTPAVPRYNKEFQYFYNNNFEIKKRSEILGSITKNYFTIAVAGTHGKTTISALVTHVLKYSGLKVTALIGGISKNYNSNFINTPNSDIIVVEADEYDRSFLTLCPDIAVITSMDADHLDIYGTKEALIKSFYLFAKQIKPNGKLIIKQGLSFPEKLKTKTISYSLKNKAQLYVQNIKIRNNKYFFDLIYNDKIIKDILSGVPGKYNIENSVAAFAVCLLMGLDEEEIKKAFKTYNGVERRFDYRINKNDFVFIDDYAHHPNELKAFITSVKELYTNKKITGIFQPHLYSRTRDFADEFAKSLELLDEVILLEIYPAREKPIKGINSKMLLNKINNKNKHLYSKTELINKLKNKNIEILLTLGAGDIGQLVKPIERMFTNKLNKIH